MKLTRVDTPTSSRRSSTVARNLPKDRASGGDVPRPQAAATLHKPEGSRLSVLMVTTEYPRAQDPGSGIFVARQVAALRNLGVQVEVLPFTSRANPLNHWRAWRRVKREISQRKYDLIHAQFGHAAPICRAQLQLPVVATFHGEELQGIFGKSGKARIKGFLLIALSQALACVVDEVIVVSEHMGRRLIRRDFHVVPSGVDLERFQPVPREFARQQLGWAQDHRIVLFSALTPHKPIKRLWLAQAAIEMLSCDLDGVELKIASGVPPDAMPLWLSAADALLLTSIQEGSPTVVKEALACSLPIVSVDVGDVRERIATVTPGAISDPTAEALGDALRTVLRDPVRSNGRQAALAIGEDALALRVLTVYRKALQ